MTKTTTNNKPTTNKVSKRLRELLEMHTYCRPAGSMTERSFCATYIDSLPGCKIDAAGNRIVAVGDDLRVMWSSHTDTVHTKPGIQKITYGDGLVSLSPNSTSSCLGADCTIGVWLMRQMILRGAPGLYIFHASEECGGLGSNHIATKTPEVVSGIEYAIAFDRRGTTSVVTHQSGGRCASDEFGTALASYLGPKYDLDTGGTFTDTANYTSLIPECTNIGVGYYYQHTKEEYFDVDHVMALLEALCRLAPVINHGDLPVRRDHTAPSVDDVLGLYGNYGRYTKTARRVSSTLEDLVYNNPEVAAAMLEGLGITADDFEEYMANMY